MSCNGQAMKYIFKIAKFSALKEKVFDLLIIQDKSW